MQTYIAIYSHPYGTDVQAFKTMERAQQWGDEIAASYWWDAFDCEPPENKDELSRQYWEKMNDNYGDREAFEIQACEIIE